jgi:hypothetical protein
MKTMLMEWLEPADDSAAEETTDEVVESPFAEAPKSNYTLNTKAKKEFDENEFDELFKDS